MAQGALQVESAAGTKPEHRVLKLTGSLGFETAPAFLEKVRAETSPALILDCAGLIYIDSAGVGALVQVFKNLQKENRKLALARITTRVKDVLEVTRVLKILPIFASVSEAEDRLAEA